MTDPIADMLTRIRNAGMVTKRQVAMPTSKMRESIARILREEGYIDDYRVDDSGRHRALVLDLRYNQERRSAINGLRRVSRPGSRVYRGAGELPSVQGGLGVAVISTSQGLMADRDARRRKLGGEVLCEVW